LVASRSQRDTVGFIVIACLTAVGGGTPRDLLLDRQVARIADPVMVRVAAWPFVPKRRRGLAAPLHFSECLFRFLPWDATRPFLMPKFSPPCAGC
jgi:hypothetical protein